MRGWAREEPYVAKISNNYTLYLARLAQAGLFHKLIAMSASGIMYYNMTGYSKSEQPKSLTFLTMPRDTDLPSDLALLGLLTVRPQHGYELYQEFNRELGRVWRIGLSQLYTQLKQMEEDGLVMAQTVPQANRPARKVYHLTSDGYKAFLDWLHQPTPYVSHIRFEFLARVYFFRLLELPGLEEFVAEQKTICRARAETLARAASETNDPFARLVIEFRKGQLEAAIQWLDRCLEIS
jgi:DNA-binding PadR family transcriptional regulator